MNSAMSNLVRTWKEIWKVLGVAQKASIVLIALVTVVAMILVVVWGSKPDFVAAYSNLDEKAASQVYELALDSGFPVKLQDGGRTVLVPSKNVNDLRLKAESANIAVGDHGTGWELFDDVKLGLTEKQQQVGYQRAVQGEIERMIADMPGVAKARVMLALPERRAILRQQVQSASASVMITMHKGQYLDAAEVKSIRYMVASGVPDLDPANVTVTDSRGRLLAGRELGTAGSGPDSQLETQAMLEEQLRQKAEGILMPIVGIENVVATVSVELDIDKIDRLSEKYDGENSVVVSEKVITEESEKQDNESAKPAGTAANIVSVSDPSASSVAAGNTSQQARKTMENQYLVPKVTEKVISHGVRIKKISVAVTVAQKIAGGEGEGSAETSPRTTEELEALRKLVASAVGAVSDPTTGREDVVEVMEGAFVGTTADGGPALGTIVQDYSGYLKFLPSMRPIAGILLLGFLFIMFRKVFNGASSDDLMIGDQFPLAESFDLQASQSKKASGNLEITDEMSALDLIRQKSVSDPDEVSDAVESLLRSEEP